MIENLNKLEKAYLNGLITGLINAHVNIASKDKRDKKCSRENCILQRNLNDDNFDDSKCRNTCQYYTPTYTYNDDDIINLLETLLNFIKQKKKDDT